MKINFAPFVPIFAVIVSACGNLQNLKPAEVPQPVKAYPAALSSQRPPSVVSPSAIEIKNRSIFLKQTAGGSVAVGLLFGPIGVLANVANIERISKELAANSKGSSLLQIDAIEEAAEAWSEKPIQDNRNSLHLRPYVVLYPDDGRKSITIIGGVYVTSSHALEDGRVWNADYHYVLPTVRGFDVLERPMEEGQLLSFKDELRDGFRQIRTELQRDLSSTQVDRRVALIWAEPLKASVLGFAGFTSGDVETDSSGKLVIRTNIDNWGGTVGAALRDTPHQVWIFSRATQYRFDADPQERKAQ
ncbi:MAG: hypothetical protein WAV95_04095 [Azonexus sp.]